MVDLPKVSDAIVTSTAPTSSVSRGDIEQSANLMAGALGKVADATMDIATDMAKKQAANDLQQQKVTLNADGTVAVANPANSIIFGRAGEAYHAAVQAGTIAQHSNIISEEMNKLHQEFPTDPAAFKVAADAWKTQYTSQHGGGEVGQAISQQADQLQTQHLNAITNTAGTNDLKQQDSSLTAAQTSARNDVIAMMRGGASTSDPNVQARIQQFDATTEARAANPLFGYSKEQAQLDRDIFHSEAAAGKLLYHVDQIYKDQGPKGGKNAAITAAQDILTNPDYKLSEAQREQYYHKAVGEIRANEAIRKQDIGEARAAYSELSMRSAAGGRIDSDDVEQVASAFRAAGDPGSAARVYSGFIRKSLNDDQGKLPLSAQTQSITALQGAEYARQAHQFFIGKGYTPEQSAGIVGNLVHESGMSPSVMGDGGTSGGLAQFHNERLTALRSYAASVGKPATDFQTQLEFIDKELNSTEGATKARLLAAKTPEESAAAFVHYERPQGYTPDNPAGSLGFQSRQNLARSVFNGRPGDQSMGPAGSAWLIANRQRTLDDAATAQWKTVMSDYEKEGTRPPLKVVNDVTNAAYATRNGDLLERIAHDSERMDLSGEASRAPLPAQHASVTAMQAAGEAGLPTPGSAVIKDAQRRLSAITKGLDENPIATAATNFPTQIKAQPPLDFSNDQSLAAGLQARGKIAQFAAQNWQTPPLSALDSADVAQVQGMLANPDPAVKGKIFNALSALPEDVRNATLAKIGSGRPELMVSVAAGSLMRGAPDVASSIIRGQQAIAIDKGYLPEKGAEAATFDTKFNEHLPASTFGLAARTDASGPYAVASGMVKARYADLSAQASDTTGKLNQDRLTRAVDDVTGGILDHNGGKLIAPVRGMPQSVFDKTMAGITDADLGNAPTGNLLEQARAQYPVLNKHDYGYVENFQKNAGFLEHWEPGDKGAAPTNAQSLDRLRPSSLPLNKPGLEIRDPNTRPIDVLGDIASHHLINEDPVVKSAYEKLQGSMTPAQQDILKDQYDYAKKNEGETRSFEEWKTVAGMPGFFRGYTFQQWPKEFNDKAYTPEQRADLDKLMGYLSKGGKSPDNAASVTTLNGEKVDANYLRNNATLESVGDGRYYVKLGKDPLRPVYAYQGANTESPQKFMLDLRNRPLGTVPPPTQVAMP